MKIETGDTRIQPRDFADVPPRLAADTHDIWERAGTFQELRYAF